MKLIHFRGLNCYSNCLVSIADAWGIEYANAFVSLWSEREFDFAPLHNTHLTRRLLINLKALGLALNIYVSDQVKGAASLLESLPKGSLIVVGMDAFTLPWSPVYQAVHNFHYFFARKETDTLFSCFDPTYQRADGQILLNQIIDSAFEVNLTQKVSPTPLSGSPLQEAREIIHTHPQTLENLLPQIQACAQGKEKNAYFLGRYMDTLINDRLLFRYYLRFAGFARHEQLFDEPFFSQWEAARNGLFKASLIQESGELIENVCLLLTNLFQQELSIAKQMLFTHEES